MTRNITRTVLLGTLSLAILFAGTTLALAVTWTGATNNVWQDGDSGNWSGTFNNGDDVVFDDTGNNTSISVSGTVTQTGMSFDNSTVDYSFSGAAIGGAGGITKNGTGLVTFNVNNTFTGKTVLNDGIVSIAADTRLGAAPGSPVADQLTFNGGTLRSTANYTLNVNRGITVNAGDGTFDIQSSTTTYNGHITGGGELVKTGDGTLSLGPTVDNSFTGGLHIQEGMVVVTSQSGSVTNPLIDTISVSPGGYIVESGATLRFSQGGNRFWVDDATLRGGTLEDNLSTNNEFHADIILEQDSIISKGAATWRIDGDISGPGAFTKEGLGTLQLRSGAKTYLGDTTVSLGAITVESVSNLSNGALTLQNLLVGGTARNVQVTLNNSAQTIGTLSGALADPGGGHTLRLVLSSNHDLTINQMADGTFDGVISGSNAEIILSAASTGALTLTGENTYTGGTTIHGGTLLLNNTSGSGTGTGNIVVNAGGGLGGTGGISGSVTVNDGLITPGASAGVFNIGGNLDFNGGTLLIDVIGDGTVPGVDHDQLVIAGNVTGLSTVDLIVAFSNVPDVNDVLTILTSSNDLSAESFNSITFLGGAFAEVNFGPGGVVTLSNFQVPEPSTAALVGLGLVVGRGFRRRRGAASCRVCS